MKPTSYGLKHYLQTFYQYSEERLPLALFLLLAAGLTEGFGLMLLLPLLASIGIETNGATDNIITTTLNSFFSSFNLPFGLIPLLIFFLLLIFFRAIIIYWRDTYLHKIQLEFVDNFGAKLHEAFGKARWSFLMKQHSADFAHILTKDIYRMGIGTQLLLKSVVSLSLVGAYLLTSLFLSPSLTLLVSIAGGFLLWLFRGYRNHALTLGKAQTAAGKAVLTSVNEFLGGIKFVKSYSAEQHYLRFFKQAATEQRSKQLAFRRNTSLAQQSFQFASAVLLCLFFYVAIETLSVPISQLLILTLIYIRLMPLLSSLQRNYEQIIYMLPAYASVMSLKQACEDAAEIMINNDTATFTLKQAIECQKVAFSYQDGNPVLQQVNIILTVGQTTAITGGSGSGKSTLADLLAGLMLADNGHVLVDGHALTESNLFEWRKQVAYVPQEVFLFHGTLRANMLWVNPRATDENLWEVLGFAAAKQFVAKLPQGLDTVIGERGIRLSGGERQRIALARALLRKPLLLILDEATSALDHDNEQIIRHSLNRLHGSMTIVLIAHRSTTVEAADQVLILQDGRVAVRNNTALLCKVGRDA